MIAPARTIWDTRIQCVGGIIAASDAGETEIYFSANFGQASLDPPRVVINPNRLYPIEPMIRRSGRFTLSIVSAVDREPAHRLYRIPRREAHKAAVSGWRMAEENGDPYVQDSIRTLFCSVESVHDTGDHTVIVGRVERVRENPARAGGMPILYWNMLGSNDRAEALLRTFRTLLMKSGVIGLVRRLKGRRASSVRPDIASETYLGGGLTEPQIAAVLEYGGLDRARTLDPPPRAPVVARSGIGVCVVGTHWGLTHCEALRKSGAGAKLFLCGRDPSRTARLAREFRADGCFTGIDAALADPRVEAVCLAMPHHLHREAAEAALAAGKHVLVEKPIATTLEDATRMIEAARRAGRILMVAENSHFRPSLGMAARRVREGDIGEPLHVLAHMGALRRPQGWAAESEKMGGGAFMDLGVHYVRAMRLLVGEPAAVTAFRPMQVNIHITGEDGLEALFESAAGWQCHMLATWSAHLGSLPDLIVTGERGAFHLWPRAGYYDFYPAPSGVRAELIGYVRPYSLQAKLMAPRRWRRRIRFHGPDDGYVEQMREFLSAISQNRDPQSGGADGRRDLEIVLQAYRSLEAGARVAIPAPVVRTASLI
jgi:predicted dehydrogenase/flavin reductase (DIM6/NTAB) family NADH-FMN oxidoreductase RutF